MMKNVDWYAVLVILAVLLVMGVVGKMDVDDALALEQVTSTARH